MKKYFFIGYKGRLQEFSQAQHGELILRNPVIEANSNSLLDKNFPERLVSSGSSIEMLLLQGAYKRWGKFGPEGDIVEVISIDVNGVKRFYLTNIFNLSSRKGTTAVDVVIFFIDGEGKKYFAGVKRKYDPCKDKTAFAGGKIDIKSYLMESPIIAAIREAKEETKLVINSRSFLEASPCPMSTDIWTEYNGRRFNGTMESLGLYHTSDEEKILTLGTKRVYQTTAFLVAITVPLGLGKPLLFDWLKAKDDAKELVIADADDIEQGLDFGFKHHEQIFQKALERLKK